MSQSIEPPPLPRFPPPLPSAPRVIAGLPLMELDREVVPGPLPPPLPSVAKQTRRWSPPPLPRRVGRNELHLIFAGIEWIFGLFCLVGALAILAAVPVLQFLSLGYLLEAGGRVARSGRLRDGFIGIRKIARVGGIVVASWLFLLPIRLFADFVYQVQIIDPNGKAATGWRLRLYVALAAVVVHIILACAHGGRLRYFLWPFNFVWLICRLARGGYYTEARDAVWDFTMSLRLPYFFWLGLRGFAAGFAWLVIPVTFLALGHAKGTGAPFVGVLGGIMLAIVLLYLPFLQLRLARTGRFLEGFNVFAVRRAYRRAPWAFAMSFVVTLLFALPLYAFKIEIVPQEAAWLPGLIFIAFIFPARLLTGWAMGRAAKRRTSRHWFFRLTGRLPFLPAAGFYVAIVFFSQYTSWNGVWSLYEQHAFLLPVPFFAM